VIVVNWVLTPFTLRTAIARRVQKLCHYGRFTSGRECVFVDESAKEVGPVDRGVGSGSRLRDRVNLVRRA
jgi:hypothetical protein